MKICLCLALIGFLLLGATTSYGGERIPPVDGIYYHRFASAVDGVEAIWINPAGLARSKYINVQYSTEYFDGKLSKNYGFGVSGDGIGIGFRRLENFLGERFDEYIMAAGIPTGDFLKVGISYRYIKNGPVFYNKRHLWNIGFLFEPNHSMSYGIVLSNLNRGRLDDERTDIEQLYSVSYSLPGNKTVFSVEMTLSGGQNLSSAEYNYGISLKLRPDLSLFGNMRSSDAFEIGIRWNINLYFLGGQGRYNNNRDHSGTSLYGGYRYIKESAERK